MELIFAISLWVFVMLFMTFYWTMSNNKVCCYVWDHNIYKTWKGLHKEYSRFKYNKTTTEGCHIYIWKNADLIAYVWPDNDEYPCNIHKLSNNSEVFTTRYQHHSEKMAKLLLAS